MLATAALVVLSVAFFEALSRSGTPREARLALRSLTWRDHLVAAWAGVVLLTRSAERAGAAADQAPPPCGDRPVALTAR